MAGQQVNLRLEADLIAALERIAREESLDRSTIIRRLLEQSLSRWLLEHAVQRYRSGAWSVGRAAEEAGVSEWEILDAVRDAGVAYPLEANEVEERLGEIVSGGSSGTNGSAEDGHRGTVNWLGESIETLIDIPPQHDGILLVGINPAPKSVAAGHYYQGRIGQRLWRRLGALGLLTGAVSGAEDVAFTRQGHGLTDVVKRPTASAADLAPSELRAGRDALLEKIAAWEPRLLLFPFKQAAETVVAGPVAPGVNKPVCGVQTFLLSGPYAAKDEARRIDAELMTLLDGSSGRQLPDDASRSQVITKADLQAGRVRLPRKAKHFFPAVRTSVELVLRGSQLDARYDPRAGPDRERSATLHVGRHVLRKFVREGETLLVSRGRGGTTRLD
jgi:TDG/mug DNA glycosylase family protein